MATEEKPALPPYPEMILKAIDALNDKDGSNKSKIFKYIESKYSDLPAGHSMLLSHHLNKLKDARELIFAKNNYMRPDPNSPPKRGRGRPPRPKEPLPSGYVPPASRPRGRPAKNEDQAPKKASDGVPKRRGRPPKKAKPAVAAVPASSGVKRGRGRPPKAKPEMILKTIDALNDKDGSNKSKISQYSDLPAGHSMLLSHHLNKLKDAHELIFAKNNYMLPDPNSPPKRGRGRPPRPKESLPSSYVPPAPRPRGRPAKNEDQAPKKASHGVPKRRGRPPKKAKPAVAAAPASPGVKRGRGRPPKAKPEVAPMAA